MEMDYSRVCTELYSIMAVLGLHLVSDSVCSQRYRVFRSDESS